VRPSISRGDERPAWLCYIALNSGVVLVALHDPLALALGEPAMIRSLLVLAEVLTSSLSSPSLFMLCHASHPSACYRVPARTARISEAALASRGKEGKCHEQPEAVPDRQRPDAAQEHIYRVHHWW
jgi:hypothetical protein